MSSLKQGTEYTAQQLKAIKSRRHNVYADGDPDVLRKFLIDEAALSPVPRFWRR